MTRPLLLVAGGLAGAWMLLIYPAVRIGGRNMVVVSGVAALLALLPAVIVVLWQELRPPIAPEDRLRRMVLMMGLRMGFVLAGSSLLFLSIEALHQTSFLLWVAVYYLIALALETAVATRRRPPVPSQNDQPPTP